MGRRIAAYEVGLILDGGNDSIALPASYVLNSSFTIVMRFRPLGNAAANARLLDYQDGGPASGFTLNYGAALSANVSFTVSNGAGSTVANIATTEMTRGQRYFLVASLTTNSAKVFVNDVQQGATDTSVALTAPTASMYIGQRAVAASNFARARIYEFAIFSKVLSAAEMTGYYNGSLSPTDIGSCDVWYKLDEKSGTTAIDSSGNGRNGTIAGGALWFTEPGRKAAYLPSTKAANFANNTSQIMTVTDTAALRVETGATFSWFAWVYLFKTNSNVLPRIAQKSPHFLCFMGDQTNAKANRLALEIQNVDLSTTEHWCSTLLQPHRWYHVGVTFNNGNCAIYVNGEADAIDILLGPYQDMASTSGNNLVWGNSTTTRNLPGLMQGMRQYNVALTPVEAKQLASGFNVGRGLVGRWPASEGTGTTVADTSGNGNDGVLAAATWETVSQSRSVSGARSVSGTRTLV